MSRILMPIVCVFVFMFAGCEPRLVEPVHTQADGGVIGSGTNTDPVRLSPDEQAKLDNLDKMPWNTYIQNGTNPQSANFSVAGTGEILGGLRIGGMASGQAPVLDIGQAQNGLTALVIRNPTIGDKSFAGLQIVSPLKNASAAGIGVYRYSEGFTGISEAGSSLSGAVQISVFGASAPFFFDAGVGGDYRFEIGPKEALRITTDGNVGIGTTTPQSQLQVRGYIQLDRTNGAVSPPAGDCSKPAHLGRMLVDTSQIGSKLWICVELGFGGTWKSTPLM